MGTIIFIVLGLVFWGITRSMRKTWDLPGDDAPHESVDTGTGRQRPVFTYEDPNAEAAYSDAPEPVLYSTATPPDYAPQTELPFTSMMSTDSELQAKLALYSSVKAVENGTPSHPGAIKPAAVSYGSKIRKNFDLRRAVLYAEILSPRYKEY